MCSLFHDFAIADLFMKIETQDAQGFLKLSNVMLQLSYVMRKPVLPYANNKGADQPADLRNLISVFVVCCLDSTISILAISKISRLASVRL